MKERGKSNVNLIIRRVGIDIMRKFEVKRVRLILKDKYFGDFD